MLVNFIRNIAPFVFFSLFMFGLYYLGHLTLKVALFSIAAFVASVAVASFTYYLVFKREP
ncbi:hypothetical protein GZ78_00895 [Endozoicomonas numazuensis]|uniref:Uncharacterized protein n=1 Tax=Endozoicomonas numazuensis TaxID=1137799 RepID=A0A081NJT3_9GAMM|nr:hypothetical protein GZ78_00895 [Endozoicomonas numazuensis]